MGNDYVLGTGEDIRRLCEEVWRGGLKLYSNKVEPPPKDFYRDVHQVFVKEDDRDKNGVQVYSLFLRLCFDWFGYTDTVEELLKVIDRKFRAMDNDLNKSVLSVAKGKEDKRYFKEKLYWFNLNFDRDWETKPIET